MKTRARIRPPQIVNRLDAFLEEHFDDIGQRSSVDLEAEFL